MHICVSSRISFNIYVSLYKFHFPIFLRVSRGRDLMISTLPRAEEFGGEKVHAGMGGGKASGVGG